MSKRTTIRWGIVGNSGLYVDQQLDRKDAIAAHVYCYDEELFKAGQRFCWSRGLSERQKTAWRARRRAGDRAVKLTISWEKP